MQQALCDESPAVRVAAGAAFNQLFRGGGGSDASSEIVPALLSSLEGDLNALEGLKQVCRQRYAYAPPHNADVHIHCCMACVATRHRC